MTTPVLIVPGYGNSGPRHWQTLWEEADPAFVRVVQRDWDHPRCDEWVDTLAAAIARAGPSVVLVAHSLGCLTVAHLVARGGATFAAALLVAVPDPTGEGFPPEIEGFAPVPTVRWNVPSVVVASTDDPYGSIAFARRCATTWGSRFVDVGAAGHLNADSGLGAWPAGRALLASLGA